MHKLIYIKKKVRQLSIVGLVFLISSGASYAKTSVWQVSDGDRTLFLGGTVHVLSQSDYPLPCQFDFAFAQSDSVFFETDIAGLDAPEFAAKLMLEGTYPSGINIFDKIKPQTRDKLTLYFAESGLPRMAFLKFKPGLLLSTLTLMELQKLGVNSTGVDKHFSARALKAKKSVGYLEQVDDQLNFILKMGEGNEDKFVEYLITSMAQFPEQFEQILSAWRSGDLEEMARVSDFDLLEKEFPSLYQTLIESRNNAWLSQIDAMLQDAPVEYILVGGLHMAGDIGLVNRLKNKGYEVQQVDTCS